MSDPKTTIDLLVTPEVTNAFNEEVENLCEAQSKRDPYAHKVSSISSKLCFLGSQESYCGSSLSHPLLHLKS